MSSSARLLSHMSAPSSYFDTQEVFIFHFAVSSQTLIFVDQDQNITLATVTSTRQQCNCLIFCTFVNIVACWYALTNVAFFIFYYPFSLGSLVQSLLLLSIRLPWRTCWSSNQNSFWLVEIPRCSPRHPQLTNSIIYTVFQKKWRQNSNHYNYGISYQN